VCAGRLAANQVCILRRMDHPAIIALKDVFVKPASSGE
jgi:hypothetical protein